MNKSTFNSYFKDFNFKELFNEMGWDNFKGRSEKILVEDVEYEIEGIVQKRDFVIAQCKSDKIPDNRIRKQIENKFSNLYYEHLLVFFDSAKTKQIWQFAVKEENKPKMVKEFQWFHKQDTEPLFQRFRNLLFHIDEEENITLLDVIAKVNENFAKNTDKVTKKFYDEFKKYHTKFLGYIENIDDELKDTENRNKQWYASIMLNRLMFCYFIQKKGFLDSNIHYLQEKLKETRQSTGKNNFYSFYRDFLLALFHEGLGKPKISRATKINLGNIPYLNGGLFEVHQLESEFENIQIKDEFFEFLFNFFDQWNWHLDQRSESSGKDINPDVVGYIFEKYINDRAAMGAYYTKEDITEYISKNTIIPFIFDEVKRNYPKPFESGGEFTELLKCSGDDYIYDAVKKGVKESSKNGIIPDKIEDLIIPENISIGLDTKEKELLERRKKWNKKTTPEIALPTEIWRETIDRWKRYFDIKQKIKSGEINQINDLITYNLNIRQFAQDLLSISDDPKFIHEIFKALSKITILDPTCGSGAFLFAALNILEPLYETCIDRMRDLYMNKNKGIDELISIIKEADSPNHPNLRYYIYKSIILNNLYGVDIMREAVEIAKLRLFLKLVAEVEPDTRKPNYGLEPLPDIDFNIRTGNTLVGFANENELYQSIENHDPLFAPTKIDDIKKECELVSKTFKKYQDSQLTDDANGQNIRKAKKELQDKLNNLNQQLNKYLAGTYGIWEEEYGKDKKKYKKDYQQWLQSHQPFHWFSEFYEIIKAQGGFDVIIGNPPYVAKSQIDYKLNYGDFTCTDLYAYISKRSLDILHDTGRHGFIIMHSIAFSSGFKELRKYLKGEYHNIWFSFFARIPAGLFSGDVRVRNCIYLLNKDIENTTPKSQFTTRIHRWFSDDREYLFPKISYSTFNFENEIPMYYSSILSKFWDTLPLNNISDYLDKYSNNNLFYKQSAYNWISVSDKPAPCYNAKGKFIEQSQVKSISFLNKNHKNLAMLLLNGRLFFSKWLTFGDEFHVTKDDVLTMNVSFEDIKESDINILMSLSKEFIKQLDNNISYKLNAGKKVGTYKTSSLWNITDKSDQIFLKYLTKDTAKVFEEIQLHVSSSIMTANGFEEEGEE